MILYAHLIQATFSPKTKPKGSVMLNFNEIAQLDCVKILMKMINYSDSVGLYILDENQLIVYWDKQLEKITGILSTEIIGKSCATDLIITESNDNTEQLIKLSRTDGQLIEVKNYSLILHNQNDGNTGGIGLIQLINNPVTFAAVSNESYLNFHGMLSRSPAMEPVFQLIQNAATTEVTVLVRGESGSGKELVAKAIHDLSPRINAPYLAINCAALSPNLLESELFGHVRGAFTGAVKDHKGLFQRSNGGTLFLDEVAELPLELQAKLLRVLQEKSIIPVGGEHVYNVDVRIVAATHRSLREEVKKGRFREDLMYRLRVVPIFIPALRERREDINLLLWYFIRQHNVSKYRQIEIIEPPAMKVLMDYQWPGNIRELQNVVEYALVVGQGSTISLSDLPPEFRETQALPINNPKKMVFSEDEEAEAIQQALQQCNGNVTSAGQLLGMSRATFWRKRKLYKL